MSQRSFPLVFGQQSQVSLGMDSETYGYTQPIKNGILSPSIQNNGSYTATYKHFKYKKPSIDNEDETTWEKESGLIVQEVYYDAPELRHLIKRFNNQTDEEGNEIPLPEIPTSIDPTQDPDYSSWGEEAASLNYIGLIAYLVKANNELHDRVKALEILTQPAMES